MESQDQDNFNIQWHWSKQTRPVVPHYDGSRFGSRESLGTSSNSHSPSINYPKYFSPRIAEARKFIRPKHKTVAVTPRDATPVKEAGIDLHRTPSFSEQL